MYCLNRLEGDIMKTIKIFISFILFFSFINILTARDNIRLAVLEFEPKNVTPETAETVTELIRTSLFNTGRFTVVEREQVQQILQEQQFQSTGLTDMKEAVEIGRLLNVQKLLLGSVNRLGNTHILNARMVDIQSGAVDLAVNKSSKGGEENIPKAIEDMTHAIIDKLGLEGAIIQVDGEKVLIDLGAKDGVRIGQAFDVLKEGEAIKDLQGNVIGTRDHKLGTIEIVNVEDGFSEARIREGAGEIARGIMVRSVATDETDDSLYPVEGIWYQVQGVHSGLCLDVKGASTGSKANVQIYEFHNGDNQLFQFVRTGSYYKIVCKESGKCLDITGKSTENSANVQQYTCHSQDNQLWKLELVGDAFKIISKSAQKCMDVKSFHKTNGGNVQIYKCHGGTNQLWRLIPAE